MFETLLWIVPAAVLVAGLWWPRGGLLVFAATLPLFAAPPGGPYLAALDVAALAAILTGMRAGRGRRATLDAGVAVFAAVTVASIFPIAYRPPSWSLGTVADLVFFLPEVERWTILYTWRGVANVVLGVGLYLAIKRAFGTGGGVAVGRAIGVGLFAALVLGYLELAGVVDLWGYRPIGLSFLEGRFHSLFFHSGWAAEFVVLATPLALAAWYGRRRAWGEIFGIAFLVLAGGAILLSGQRGAWFAALAQILVALFLLRRKLWRGWQWRRVVAAGGAFAVFAVLLVAVISGRSEVTSVLQDRVGDVVSNLSGREVVWKFALTMTAERPLAGWGTGSFSPVFDQKVLADSTARIPGVATLGHNDSWLTAHSTYLMLLAERGVMGLGSLLILGVLLGIVLWRAIGSESKRERSAAIGIVISATGFAVYGLVQYMFFPRVNALLFWMILGSAALLDNGPERPRLERAVWMIAVCALLLAPFRALLWEPAPARGNRAFGFHALEAGEHGVPYQWTAAETAVEAIPWEDEVLRLRVANGHPKAGETPVLVEVLVDGAIVDQVIADGGWEEMSAYLGEPTRDTIIIGIRVNRTFRPFIDYEKYPDLERSRDIRRLGVAVGQIWWEKSSSGVQLHLPDSE